MTSQRPDEWIWAMFEATQLDLIQFWSTQMQTFIFCGRVIWTQSFHGVFILDIYRCVSNGCYSANQIQDFWVILHFHQSMTIGLQFSDPSRLYNSTHVAIIEFISIVIGLLSNKMVCRKRILLISQSEVIVMLVFVCMSVCVSVFSQPYYITVLLR